MEICGQCIQLEHEIWRSNPDGQIINVVIFKIFSKSWIRIKTKWWSCGHLSHRKLKVTRSNPAKMVIKCVKVWTYSMTFWGYFPSRD